jgi:hypothetical protein
MKVIDNMKKKDIQHWMGSQLIEVMKMTMQKIEIGSNVNLIQMKLMKVISTTKTADVTV